jgi:hypothetical protein
MRHVMRHSKVQLWVITLMMLAVSPARAQKLMVGVNAGADVTDINTMMLVGMDISFRLSSHFRFDAIGADDFAQPGASMYVGYAFEYQKASGQLRPYVGGGATLGNRRTDMHLYDTPGWLVISGVDVVTRFGRPYVELRLQGDGVVHEHVMMGFRLIL